MPIKRWSADAWDAIKGNGCTGIPDLYLETPCNRHDRHYETHVHRDGRPITRFEADVELAKDAWKSLPVVPPNLKWDFKSSLKNAVTLPILIPFRAVAKVVVPPVVFGGVRIFGGSHW